MLNGSRPPKIVQNQMHQKYDIVSFSQGSAGHNRVLIACVTILFSLSGVGFPVLIHAEKLSTLDNSGKVFSKPLPSRVTAVKPLTENQKALNHELIEAIKSKKDIAFIESLIERGADVNYYYQDYVLSFAYLRGGDLKLTELLLNNGADPNAHVYSHTLLNYSTLMGANEAAIQLLHYGADPNKHELYRATLSLPLYTAIEKNNLFLVKELLKYGANPNISGFSPCGTPLAKASVKGQLETVSVLLIYGAKFDANPRDEGPLICAINYPAIMKFLIKNGYTPTQIEREKYSLHAYEAAMCNVESMQLLYDLGFSINALDEKGNSALMNILSKDANGWFYKCTDSERKGISFYLQHSTAPNAPNKAGITPYAMNYVNGNDERTRQLLLDAHASTAIPEQYNFIGEWSGDSRDGYAVLLRMAADGKVYIRMIHDNNSFIYQGKWIVKKDALVFFIEKAASVENNTKYVSENPFQMKSTVVSVASDSLTLRMESTKQPLILKHSKKSYNFDPTLYWIRHE